MSIVACVKVYDGIVLGADSMTQISGPIEGQTQFVKAYSNARKLFRIGDLPVGVLTHGLGNIGTRSIESFLYEFSREVRKDSPVDSIAGQLLGFIRGHYEQQFGQLPIDQRPIIGFYLAGYSPGQPLATEREFILPRHDAPMIPRNDDDFGASWRGVGLPFRRLFFGVDPEIYDIMHANGVSPEVIERVREAARRLAAPVAFSGMPVQDAIGYCKFILETTINQALYEIGVPSCGGPLQLAIITPRGFQWISELVYSL